MSKHNFFIKKVKNRILSINVSIESYFTKLKFLILNYRKVKFIKNNRVFFSLAALVILTLTYFLLPTIYNKNIIKLEIENQVFKKYSIKIKPNNNFRYGLLPKPHFVIKDLLILKEDKEIGIVKNFKAYLKLNNFFSLKNLEITDLIFNRADFNIDQNDLSFFKKLLETPPNENSITIKNSNIFFEDGDGEVLFLNKIIHSKFFYDSFNLQNILNSKNEIFNVPYKLFIKNDKFNKTINTVFKSNKIRMNIENSLSYSESLSKKGEIDFSFINKTSSINYKIKNNNLTFKSDLRNSFYGEADFKPFYLKANFNYDGMSTKNFLANDSILIDLIKSEVFNNQNLNVDVSFNIKDITNITELNNLLLKIELDQGNIDFSNSKINWKNDLEINLNEGLLNYDKDEISLIGKLDIKAKNILNFYKSFQIKKNNRTKINQIELDFIYNFSTDKFIFDNIKINKKSHLKVDEFIEEYNLSKKGFPNKITFKKFIKNLFSAYAG
jgi:hypothetical protein